MLLARQVALRARCTRTGAASLAGAIRYLQSFTRTNPPAAFGSGTCLSIPLWGSASQHCTLLPARAPPPKATYGQGTMRFLAAGYHGPPRRSAWKVKQRKLPRSQRKNKLRTHHGVMKRFFLVKVKGADGIVKTGYAHTRSGKQHLQAGNRRKADRKKRRLKIVTTKGHIRKLRKLLPHGIRRQRLS